MESRTETDGEQESRMFVWLITNRNWTNDTGAKHEKTDYHRMAAWGQFAEQCNQHPKKGQKSTLKDDSIPTPGRITKKCKKQQGYTS